MEMRIGVAFAYGILAAVTVSGGNCSGNGAARETAAIQAQIDAAAANGGGRVTVKKGRC